MDNQYIPPHLISNPKPDPLEITITGGGLDCNNRASRPDLTDAQWNNLCPVTIQQAKKHNYWLYIAIACGILLALGSDNSLKGVKNAKTTRSNRARRSN